MSAQEATSWRAILAATNGDEALARAALDYARTTAYRNDAIVEWLHAGWTPDDGDPFVFFLYRAFAPLAEWTEKATAALRALDASVLPRTETPPPRHRWPPPNSNHSKNKE